MSSAHTGSAAPAAALPEHRPDAWSATAQAYDTFSREVTLPFAEDAARLVRIADGTRVLDVAAGTGHFTFAAARRGAKVLATDFAPGMIEVLRRKVGELGIAGAVQAAVMDGQALDVPNDSLDVAASIFGVLFFPDQDAGLRELHRVLVPGGRAVVSTWAPPPHGDMPKLLGAALSKAMPEMPPPAGTPHWAELGDAGAFRDRLLASGFAHAHVVELRHLWAFHDVPAFIETMSRAAPPAVALLEAMTTEQRRTFGAAIADQLRSRQGDGPFAVTHEGMIAVATKAA